MYCKGQLVQLQRDSEKLRSAGLGLAAISYDSGAVLDEFAKRKSIAFPLLSDHESEVIRAYGVADRRYRQGMQLDVDKEQVVLYSQGNVPVFGLSYPAAFVLSRDGRVKWRFVSEGSELRITGAALLEEAVGGIAEGARTAVPGSRQVGVITSTTNASVGLGNRIRIAIELKIPAGFHVYSPDVGGDYKGVSWQMDTSKCLEIGEPVYPKAQRKLMQSTNETLPVYEEGVLRISREVFVKPALKATDASLFQMFCDVCLDPASNIKAAGSLRLQVCDEKQCYPPQSLPLEWKFQFFPPDRQRSPDELKREFEEFETKTPAAKPPPR